MAAALFTTTLQPPQLAPECQRSRAIPQSHLLFFRHRKLLVFHKRSVSFVPYATRTDESKYCRSNGTKFRHSRSHMLPTFAISDADLTQSTAIISIDCCACSVNNRKNAFHPSFMCPQSRYARTRGDEGTLFVTLYKGLDCVLATPRNLT